jgi:hypothetical protein
MPNNQLSPRGTRDPLLVLSVAAFTLGLSAVAAGISTPEGAVMTTFRSTVAAPVVDNPHILRADSHPPQLSVQPPSGAIPDKLPPKPVTTRTFDRPTSSSPLTRDLRLDLAIMAQSKYRSWRREQPV